MKSREQLPLVDTWTPAEPAEVREMLREAHADGTVIYPLGGGSSMDFGLPAQTPGIGLSLGGLKRVVDYPARDMTITVEVGITLDGLAAVLAKDNQRLPIDLPDANRATLGGVIATNTSGPRRYAHGTVRDYVIGITAVDGRGTTFHGGGRVVKNVAGYDFCKLLCGSLGTIGVITQVTLRVKPIPECSRLVACRVRDWNAAEKLLEALVTTRTAPAAIELLAGPAWRNDPSLGGLQRGEMAHLAVGLEGTRAEVDWMTGTLCDEWRALGHNGHVVANHQAAGLWMRLAQFPAEREAPAPRQTPAGKPAVAHSGTADTAVAHGGAHATIKASLRPSRVIEFARLLEQIDPACSIQSHAGNGVVIARLSALGPEGLAKTLVGQLQPAAGEHGGHVVVLSCARPEELTRQARWGTIGAAAAVMEEVKRQFDPKGILNRGRFVYSAV